MTVYQYKGRSARGQLVSGRIEADGEDAAAVRLVEGGVTPIDILIARSQEASSAHQDLSQLTRQLGLGRPTTADLVLFSRQMYTITKSGIPLLRGLRGLGATTHNAVLREALEDVVDSLEAGRDLAASFGRHPQVFSQLYTSIIAVGESTGTLEEAFLRLSEYLSRDEQMQNRVKSAMRYPLIVVVVIAVAIGVITTFVIPRFAPLFRVLGNDIPWPTRVIMGASNIARNDWHLLAGAAIIATAAIRRYISAGKGRYRWHALKLRLPVFGKLAHEATLGRVTRTLSIALSAGMPMIQTLNIIAKTSGNEVMAERILRIRDAVERGEPLSRAAQSVGLFPPLVLQMLAVGEETGEISGLLEEVAGFYDREVDFALQNISSAIEPILIVVVGGMVLILALGVFLPMWNMIAKVGAAQ